MPPLYFRLRVRNALDTANAFVVSSYPPDGTDADFSGKPPSGDGQSVDVLKGTTTTGSYTVRIIDAATAANTRAITKELADVNARQQLLSRKAIVEKSATGASWTGLYSGYVNAVRAIDAITYEFALGDTQRKEVSTDVFKTRTARFYQTTSIIGGPIRGGFGAIRDYGGWGFKVDEVNGTYDFVQLKIVPGKIFDPRKALDDSGNLKTLTTISDALRDYTNAIARPHFEESAARLGADIHGSFPGLVAEIFETDGDFVGSFTPLPVPTLLSSKWYAKFASIDRLVRNEGADGQSLFLDQNGLAPDGVTPLVWAPTVGVEYSVYVSIKEISKDNPLHYSGHPVQLWEAIRLDNGIPYDASVLPAMIAAVGTDIRLELRITQAYKIGAFDSQVIYGPFGLATRMVNGERQLFSSRTKSIAIPVDTITVNDLKEPGKPYDLEESTAIKTVVLKQLRLIPWTTEETSQPEADALIAVPSTIPLDNSDDDATVEGAGEVTYDIPGQITTAQSRLKGGTAGIGWLAGIGNEVFDRWGRGIHAATFDCLPSVTALIGHEVILDLPHLPVAVVGNTPVTQKGTTPRIFQVVSRTETPTGPTLKLLDAGSTDAPGIVPTFTVAANAGDARKFVDVAITNGPAIAAIGGRIRVWVATGVAPASGSGILAALIDPAVDALSFTLPGFDAGTKVWVQMQTVIADQRPGALSAFQSVDLTDLNPPTGLAVSAQDAGDPSRRTLTWAVGANATDIPVEVALRLTSEPSSANRVVAVLPPGSTQYELTGLDAANRTASVRHIESPPYAGASSYATVAVNTSGTERTLNPPTDPRGFSMADGTFGMDVIATEFPSDVEFQVKLGAGAFATVGFVTSVAGGRTVFSDFATNDGITRTLRARHVASGSIESAWTAEVIAEPWTEAPPDEPATGSCTRAFAFAVS